MINRFDVNAVRLQIENLLREYPDLADDETLRFDTIDGATSMREALEQLVTQVRLDEAFSDTLADRLIQEMKARKERLDQRVEMLRALILRLMQSADLKKIVLAQATLSQRNGQPQIVGTISPEELPDELCRIRREANRTKIKEALLRGDLIPGLQLGNGPPSLTITKK